jgi:hypothetical protein
MKYKNLHTHTLENLFGPISLHILKQYDTIRIVELKDKECISRTLAIVRFLNIKGNDLMKAYSVIRNGGLLGKTLCDHQINFEKEQIGSIKVKTPSWLKKDFNSDEDLSLGFISNICVTDSVTNEKFLFSEIIEIIPLELMIHYKHKIRPLEKISSDVMSLLKEAKIELIKPENT